MKYLFIFCMLFSFFSSCNEVKEKNGIILRVSLDEQETSIMEIFKRIDVVPLETTDSCLLIWPDKALYVDSCFMIFDSKNPALFCFDKNGKFIRKIGRKGSGPEEYVDVYDAIYDDENRCISFLSPFGELFSYTPDGKFIERKRLPQKVNYQSFEEIHDFYVTWTLPVSDKDFGISFISKDSLQCVKEDWQGNRNLASLYPKCFYKYGDEISFFRSFDRNVYKVSKEKMSILYRWDFGKDNYSMEEFGISMTTTKGEDEFSLLIDKLRNGTIPYLFCSQKQTDKYYYAQLIFDFNPHNNYHIFYRKLDGKSYFFRRTVEGLILNPIYSNNEFMLCLAYKGNLEECRKILQIEDCVKLDKMCEDDNPCLIKCCY